MKTAVVIERKEDLNDIRSQIKVGKDWTCSVRIKGDT